MHLYSVGLCIVAFLAMHSWRVVAGVSVIGTCRGNGAGEICCSVHYGAVCVVACNVCQVEDRVALVFVWFRA